jgi:putative glutamine amidotransferase
MFEHKMRMRRRPKIAITTRLEVSTNRFYLARDYMEGVEAAGGTPILVSLIPNEDYIASVMEDVDGVLLPGSDSDVDPQIYGEQPHPKLGAVVPEKDATDLMVLAEAERLNLPVFGICFGMQSLNVSRGGTLIQDIDAQIENPLKHQQGAPRDRDSHAITIEEGSRLAALTDGLGEVRVNSHHHQSVAKIGENLKVTATAPDGVIECIEDTRNDRSVIGVQWHPELSWKANYLSSALFRDFVSRCG